MKKVAVVTTSRADYGILRPVLAALEESPALEPVLIAGGTHLLPGFGETINQIIADGFAVKARVPLALEQDSPEGVAAAMGEGLKDFARTFSRLAPDLILLPGDRFEIHAAATAAAALLIPIVHLHGGELTFGALDDAFRHSITKLSHLHFPATETYRQRLMQMGEEPWRITVSGAPALDNLKQTKILSRAELAARYHIDPDLPYLLATFHPVTMETGETGAQIAALLEALRKTGRQVVFTYPNCDASSGEIIQVIREFHNGNPRAHLLISCGTEGYFSLMQHAAAMVGNSSSGIIEAASFKLPVVNIGTRQGGRVRGRNVIDVGNGAAEILQGIEQALSPEFGPGLASLVNPYGDGRAAPRIIRKLTEVVVDKRLLMKKFYDLPPSTPTGRQ